MLLQLHFYLLPAKGQGWEVVKYLLCVRSCVHLPHFYINLYISFIYEDIVTKFAENVCGYENISVKTFKPLATILDIKMIFLLC